LPLWTASPPLGPSAHRDARAISLRSEGRAPSPSAAKAPTRRLPPPLTSNNQTNPPPKQNNTAATEATTTRTNDGRAVRRSLNQTGRYVRQPTNDPSSQQKMEEDGVGYSSTGLVAQMREQGNLWTENPDDATKKTVVKLAQAYGYCWGVERAVRMAYEARAQFPEKRVLITNEIIHNPEVNDRLRELDIEILEETAPSTAGSAGTKDLINGKDYSSIQEGDVVIFPAFGATVQEMQTFRDRGVHMVDTTCPWVAKVWNSVDTHGRKSFTSVIHGKYSHEETVATASFAESYIIVKDLEEAKYVCDYILNGGDREAFLAKFKKAVSKGFCPDRDLQKVGLANQTTMLKGETEAIGKLLERTMMRKHGAERLGEHFLLMDTICDATQERQDALYAITDDKEIDMLVVVGGFNSSNTSHLQEIAEHKGLPSFWVDSAARIDVSSNKVTHKTGWGELKETEGWIPLTNADGKALTIGVTSGASTPDRAVEEVLDRIFRIRDPAFAGIAPRECKPVEAPAH
jgi:4-hydroxy-3-methylbut-2-enyl diphosphate reductase